MEKGALKVEKSAAVVKVGAATGTPLKFGGVEIGFMTAMAGDSGGGGLLRACGISTLHQCIHILILTLHQS
jgi:hypothetical protein